MRPWNFFFFCAIIIFADLLLILSSLRCQLFSSELKKTLKAFDDFKIKQKSVWSNAFWYIKVYIFLYKSMLKNFPSDKVNGTKNVLFFFRELQLITVLLLICDSYMSWSTRFFSLKLYVGFPIFDSFSFLLKFIFLFHKMHGLSDF